MGGCLLPLRKETFHLQWQQLRRKRWMMPRLSKRIRKIVSVLINHAWTVRVLCAQRLHLNSFLHLSTFIHFLWLRELPGVDSPLLSAKASILLKNQFANSGTLKKEYLNFLEKNLQAAPTTAHNADEGRGTLPSSSLHAANFSVACSRRTETVALSLFGTNSSFSLAQRREYLKKQICWSRDF